MTLPANIRINVSAPFPATVKGSAPLTVAKAGGIWTVGLNLAGLATQVPAAQNFQTDFILVYDSLARTYFKASLSVIAARPQRSVTAGPVVIAVNDQILNLNLGASLIIPLPSYLVRGGVPLTFKDVGKKAGQFPLTIQSFNIATPAEYIDGLPSISLNNPGQSITLVPANDGVTTGWSQE